MSGAEETRAVKPAVQPMPVVPAPAQRPMALQQRAERMLTRAIPQARYQLMRVGPAGLTGIAALVMAGAVALAVLLPAQQSVFALRTELTKAAHATPGAAPIDTSPKQFAATLPTREQVPALLGVVLGQATGSGIVLEQGRYTYSPATANRLARYTFEFPVKADYGNVRTFINNTLTAIPALGLDKLHVERKNVGDTLVSAEVGFVIYLRGG
ncbi:MAG: hypothetical protein ACYC9Z_14075 [Casimicrobiaceae bacterium]